MKAPLELDSFAEMIRTGDRRALARAITLVESTRLDHRLMAQELLQKLSSHGHEALRLGFTGTPGVGKSTFIETLGLMLCAQGLKVAVLAVDPSSARSGGSILGDKTRMERLARHPNAYIRPSPSGAYLGGVARRTREAVVLVEAAQFDVIVIETVGVGQSETLVAELADVFVLLIAPGGGDELQGVKRGIMEVADLIVVNKADGALKPAAERTCADYAGALRLLRPRPQDPPGFPKVLTASALLGEGLETLWHEIEALFAWRKAHGIWQARRNQQMRHWFVEETREQLLACLETAEAKARLAAVGAQVVERKLTPYAAAKSIVLALTRGGCEDNGST